MDLTGAGTRFQGKVLQGSFFLYFVIEKKFFRPVFFLQVLRSDGDLDSSSDEERQIIEDEDMEDSPTDIPEIWMSDRNDEDTKFVRAKRDAIPTKSDQVCFANCH